jgi:hypothetical protein
VLVFNSVFSHLGYVWEFKREGLYKKGRRKWKELRSTTSDLLNILIID